MVVVGWWLVRGWLGRWAGGRAVGGWWLGGWVVGWLGGWVVGWWVGGWVGGCWLVVGWLVVGWWLVGGWLVCGRGEEERSGYSTKNKNPTHQCGEQTKHPIKPRSRVLPVAPARFGVEFDHDIREAHKAGPRFRT